MSEHETDTCLRCGAEDNHPKFHVIGPIQGGLGWATYHHDCAALLGHAKASVIVDHAEGKKGDELRAILTNPDHPVHAKVAEVHKQEAEMLHRANLQALGESE